MAALSTPLHTEDMITTIKLEHITKGFFDLSLPKEEWTHSAHLVTGLYLLFREGLAMSEHVMPDMIRAYNQAKGGINSDTEGYHHTLTIFYLRILEQFRKSHASLTLPLLCKALLSSPEGMREFPFTHYSKAVLFSLKARKTWVEPDLTGSI